MTRLILQLTILIFIGFSSCSNKHQQKEEQTDNLNEELQYIRMFNPTYALKIEKDIDGDEQNDLIEFGHTGGAHCCYTFIISLSKNDSTYYFDWPMDYIKNHEGRIDTNKVKVDDFDNDGKDEIYATVYTYNGVKETLPKNSGLTSNYIVLEYENNDFQVDNIPWSISVNQYFNSKYIQTNKMEELNVKEKNGKYGFINKENEWIILPELNSANNFNCNRALVSKDGVKYVINQKGEIIFYLPSHIYPQTDTFPDACFLSIMGCSYGYDCDERDFCVIDTLGRFVENSCFDDIREFNEGLASAAIDRKDIDGYAPKWGFVNTNFEWVIPPKYDITYSFYNGKAIVTENGQHKYLNKKGQEIPIKYSDGKAKVVVFGKESYLYESGKWEEIDE